jgi:hypothetical protein
MHNMGKAFIARTYIVRAAANLAAGATATTMWVPAKGARCVVFNWTGTDGDAPQNQGVEGTNAVPLVPGGVGLSANNSRLLTSSVSSVINQLGGIRQVVAPIAADGLQFIVVEGVRATMLGHATNQMDNVACVATVYYDSEQAADIGMIGHLPAAV